MHGIVTNTMIVRFFHDENAPHGFSVWLDFVSDPLERRVCDVGNGDRVRTQGSAAANG
jgi:hypothetical protein